MKTSLEGQAIAVWSSPVYSRWELSDGLRQLRVTHTIDPEDKMCRARRINMKRSQPREVHIAGSISGLRPNAINFIVASYGLLSHTNIPSIQGTDLDQALRLALLSDRVTKVKVLKLGPVDFMNLIAKPSLLNEIQTEIHRIQPYSLRKETNSMVIRYFNSKIGKRQLVQFLNRSLKLDRLKQAVLKGDNLRAAVAQLPSMDAETIALQMDVPAFDIVYLSKAKI